MGKVGFSPIIGLAVVVALALAAVFGAMSLTNPAFAQNTTPITGLKVAEVTSGTVELEWAATDNDAVGNYQARWEEKGDDSTITAWVAGSNQAPFVVVVDDDDVVTATIAPVGPAALVNGGTYTFFVRNVVGGLGPVSMVDATPNMQPTFEFGDADPDDPDADPPYVGMVGVQQVFVEEGRGYATLTWVATDGSTPSNISGWQYRHCNDNACGEDVESDTRKDSAWTDIPDSDADTRTHEVENLAEGEDYYFQVQPVNGMAVPEAASISALSIQIEILEPLPALPTTTLNLAASGGDRSITLRWARVAGAHMYEYSVSYVDAKKMKVAVTSDMADTDTFTKEIAGLINGTEYTIEMTVAVDEDSNTVNGNSEPVTVTATPMGEDVVEDVGDVDPSFSPDSTGSGSSTHYTVEFQIKDDDDESTLSVNTRQYDLIVEFHEDYSVPASIRNTSVAVTTRGGQYPTPTGVRSTRTFTPEDVTVDGEEIFISLGDMDEQDEPWLPPFS